MLSCHEGQEFPSASFAEASYSAEEKKLVQSRIEDEKLEVCLWPSDHN